MDKAFLVFKRKSETEKMISSAIKILYIESDHFCRSIGSNSIDLQELFTAFPFAPYEQKLWSFSTPNISRNNILDLSILIDELGWR